MSFELHNGDIVSAEFSGDAGDAIQRGFKV